MIAIADRNLREKDETHMRNYSPERTVFEDGSYVLVEHRHNSLRMGPPSKLLPYWAGPLLVKHHNSEGNYVLQDLITAKLSDYHMSRIKEFLYDERTLTPLQAAVADSLDEFLVERVVEMHGDARNKKADLTFTLQWAGTLEESTESWENCHDNDVVQTFLRNHPLKRVQRLAKKVVEELSDDEQ